MVVRVGPDRFLVRDRLPFPVMGLTAVLNDGQGVDPVAWVIWFSIEFDLEVEKLWMKGSRVMAGFRLDDAGADRIECRIDEFLMDGVSELRLVYRR